jgi:8-oxo-dGTP pyrophosphatase MutT (NUDIX family)
VLEETGVDVSDGLFALGIAYGYVLRPELAARWEHLYGPGVERIAVVAFAAEWSGGDPVLDPAEHDAFAWCSYEHADALLD